MPSSLRHRRLLAEKSPRRWGVAALLVAALTLGGALTVTPAVADDVDASGTAVGIWGGIDTHLIVSVDEFTVFVNDESTVDTSEGDTVPDLSEKLIQIDAAGGSFDGTIELDPGTYFLSAAVDGVGVVWMSGFVTVPEPTQVPYPYTTKAQVPLGACGVPVPKTGVVVNNVEGDIPDVIVSWFLTAPAPAHSVFPDGTTTWFGPWDFDSTCTAVERLSGAGRYDTSAAISKSAFGAGADVVYIANGMNFPDALSGAPVAGLKQAPVLLVQADAIPAAVKAELDRLKLIKPFKIVILGGNGAVGLSVENQLKAWDTAPSRLAGGSRFETSAAISKSAFGAGADVVYIANGMNFPDALSGAPVAGLKQAPVLLVQADAIPAAVKAELDRLKLIKPFKIVILGGNGAVGLSVENQLKAWDTAPSRLAGGSRFETSAAISKSAFPAGANVVYVANGMNFPDALSGAPVAGMKNAPVLLVQADAIPAAVKAELDRLKSKKPFKIVILGGAGAVSASVATQLAAYVTP